MFFLVSFGFCGAQQKARQRLSPAGLGTSSISLADLNQAIAVRRHGGSMMVVVTVMEAALHLIKTLSEGTG
jgi:hypothetical protein